MTSIPVIQRKRGPAPTGKTPVTSLRLPDDITAALDAAIAAEPEATRPSRSELIRRIVAEWLKERGLLGKD